MEGLADITDLGRKAFSLYQVKEESKISIKKLTKRGKNKTLPSRKKKKGRGFERFVAAHGGLGVISMTREERKKKTWSLAQRGEKERRGRQGHDNHSDGGEKGGKGNDFDEVVRAVGIHLYANKLRGKKKSVLLL